MARKEKTYSLKELSKKAQERAITDYRDEREWDSADSDQLTELFEQDLDDHYGLGDGMKANWSLSYVQGDGVCFHGPVDVDKFTKTDPGARESFSELAPFATARIDQEGRYCGPTSMDVRVDLDGDPEQLLPEKLRQEYLDWYYDMTSKVRQWNEKRYYIVNERQRPIEEWKTAVLDWERRAGKPFGEMSKVPHLNPKAWIPGHPGPKPPEVDIPIPPKPSSELPQHLKGPYEEAAREWARLEKLALEFVEYLKDRIVDIAREMEKTGYAEIEYHSSDEYIVDMIEGNDYKFTKEGEMAR